MPYDRDAGPDMCRWTYPPGWLPRWLHNATCSYCPRTWRAWHRQERDRRKDRS